MLKLLEKERTVSPLMIIAMVFLGIAIGGYIEKRKCKKANNA